VERKETAVLINIVCVLKKRARDGFGGLLVPRERREEKKEGLRALAADQSKKRKKEPSSRIGVVLNAKKVTPSRVEKRGATSDNFDPEVRKGKGGERKKV